MIKHIIIVCFIVLTVSAVFVMKFGLPNDASAFANFGSYSGGTSAVFICIYFGLISIWQSKQHKYTIEDHINLMNTYKSPNSGGYTNRGYEFIKWIWPNTVSQLTRDDTPTLQDIIDNDNLNEMSPWIRSLNKIDKKLIPDFTNEMIAEEVKLAWLCVHINKIPEQYRINLSSKIDRLSLTDKEVILFDSIKNA